MIATDPAIDHAAPPPRRRIDRRFLIVRSIAALMLREMATRFGRKPGGYIWIIAQPMAFIIILAVAFSLLQKHPRLGTSFLLFKGSGFLLVQQFRVVSQMVGTSLSFSRALLEYPGVSWIHTVIARFVLNAVMGTLVIVLILGGIVTYEGLSLSYDWPKLAAGVGLTMLLALGMGCLNCVLFLRFEVWSNLWALTTAPLMIVSGVILLYEDMPRFAQQILWYNPVLHVTGILRDGLYSTYNPTYTSTLYVVYFALIPMVLGLLLLRAYHRELLER